MNEIIYNMCLLMHKLNTIKCCENGGKTYDNNKNDGIENVERIKYIYIINFNAILNTNNKQKE